MTTVTPPTQRPRAGRFGRITRIAAVLIAVPLVLAGCSEASTTPGASTGAVDTASTALITEATTGVVEAPPTEPVTVTPGKKVWVVSCGESVTTCSNPAHGALDAAEVVGWTGSICDGKLNPDGWSTCIRQGIAAKADIIMTAGLDCAAMSGALTEAKAAGIMTVGIAGNDCDKSGGEALFTTTTNELNDRDNEGWWNLLGSLQAKWLIGQNNGAAKILNITFSDAIWGPYITKGFTDEVAKHSGSSIVASLQLSNADVGSGALAQKFSTALLQNPTANAIAVPIDGWFLAGLGQAVVSSGRADTLKVIGGLGSIPNYALIRSNGGEDATVAFSGTWDGWSGVDAALRVLAGQKVLPAGNGLQVVDASTNLPAENVDFSFNPVIDYQADYKKAWGVK